MANKSKEVIPSWKKKTVLWLWRLIGAGIAGIILIFTLLLFDNLPTFEQLENPKINQASVVYSRLGTSFGKYYIENRESVSFNALNPHLIDALVATEDKRFLKHSGIDFTGLGRVIVKTGILQQSGAGGGSTISQQLAKLLFERPDLRGKNKLVKFFQLVRIKFKEWLIAIKLERRYTKGEILAMYLNQFDFINGAHGIQAAAQTYFGKSQDELPLVEAATLVGMLQNPWKYNPNRFPEASLKRRNIVLNQMYKNGHLTKEELEEQKAKELDMSNFKRSFHTEGPAPYFRMEMTKWLKDLFNQDEYRKPDGSKYNIYKDGLKIYTTIDLKMQKHAEAAMKEHMASVQKRFDRQWGRRDPWTYQADKVQKSIRKNTLNQLIRDSERYQSLWQKHFGQSLNGISQKIDNLYINDKSIKSMLGQEKDAKYFKKMLQAKRLSKSQVAVYKKIMAMDEWSDIQKQWPAFQKALDKSFNTKIKMKVFAYNDKGEKMVEMTPLDSIKYHRKILQIGSLAIDPKTGEIKMWIGGVDFKWFKVDHTKTRRQVGSTFKPFVYSTAIALQGLSPCTEFEDKQYTIPANEPNFKLAEAWSPSNADGKFYHTKYNLYQGLLYSKNSISVRLMMLLRSVNPIIGLVHNMGIDSSLRYANGRYVIPRVPSICLGAADLKVQEMAGAYTTFANNGVYSKPYFIQRIEDKNGRLIYQSSEYHNTALNPQYNYVMVDMLRNNTSVYHYAFPGIECEFGGKTGTTNDYVDSWFMGITPDLIVGTWVGGDENWIHFLDLAQGQGFVNARPFFAKFMQRISEDTSVDFDRKAKFIRPAGPLEIELNCDKYKAKQKELESDLMDGEFENSDEDFDEGMDDEIE